MSQITDAFTVNVSAFVNTSNLFFLPANASNFFACVGGFPEGIFTAGNLFPS